ncbi:MAG: bifunctional adenosylcobinamide kinase/adenosylcobinamide-phosphate guanylyltransferase [Sodalinema sp.]|uniref:bifunctional adenosylcobinamide kinase/adenosylcobinamide-phosphate guanylyltransferase n=1 Tax=Sodalinema sp. TaxID=3080550 RepID=UPI0012230EE4|nr:MAG: bifunctional adenosylcobinamide kinase/adenosylcobinamide-phosphate guanylyltransferase [Phormidium sp. SL48-SHIP]
MGNLVLVTGAARSGKSEFAERLAEQHKGIVTYIATARSNSQDRDWQARIERHRQRRPRHWRLQEVPLAISACLEQWNHPQNCLLLDSLGTWVANTLDESDTDWGDRRQTFLHQATNFQGTCILVAEETGWGVVPAYPSGRMFRDRLGELTRHLGAMADQTYLIVAGRILNLTEIADPL